jgi:hypothetical protein
MGETDLVARLSIGQVSKINRIAREFSQRNQSQDSLQLAYRRGFPDATSGGGHDDDAHDGDPRSRQMCTSSVSSTWFRLWRALGIRKISSWDRSLFFQHAVRLSVHVAFKGRWQYGSRAGCLEGKRGSQLRCGRGACPPYRLRSQSPPRRRRKERTTRRVHRQTLVREGRREPAPNTAIFSAGLEAKNSGTS